MKRLLFITLIVLVFEIKRAFGNIELPPALHAAKDPPLGCHKRLYTYRVTQVDTNGHECWDYVSVMSCWGRCDSREISDWKFPYKKSYHPVCVHAGRSKVIAKLKNCHPLADPSIRLYEYMEANGCHCQTCTTTDTSCEAPNSYRDQTSVKVLALAGINPDDLEY